MISPQPLPQRTVSNVTEPLSLCDALGSQADVGRVRQHPSSLRAKEFHRSVPSQITSKSALIAAATSRQFSHRVVVRGLQTASDRSGSGRVVAVLAYLFPHPARCLPN